VVSTALVVERAEEGHAYPVHHPVYFISEVLGPSKKKYPQVQKLLYAVLLNARKLRHYFDDHKVIVVIGFPIGGILHNKEAIGRIAKWACELGAQDIEFWPHTAIKTQALVDFVSEWTEQQVPDNPKTAEVWRMYFNGSLKLQGAGAGILFIAPGGEQLKYALQLLFLASNNAVEYEALIHGLNIVISLGIKRLMVYGDSLVVISQINKEWDCSNDYGQILHSRTKVGRQILRAGISSCGKRSQRGGRRIVETRIQSDPGSTWSFRPRGATSKHFLRSSRRVQCFEPARVRL
jgi:ribonuclease HI